VFPGREATLLLRPRRTRQPRVRHARYRSAIPDESPPIPHLVSRGYQQNFATDDKRVAVINAVTGQLVDSERAIKSNFRLEGFTLIEGDDGAIDTTLEKEFAGVERVVLDQIRRASPDNCGSSQHAAVVRLFALHLARSETLRDSHDDQVDQMRRHDLPTFEDDEELRAKFVQHIGREPVPGELVDLAIAQLDNLRRGNRWFVERLRVIVEDLVALMEPLHVQLITIAEPSGPRVRPLPGFVLGDVPVVHANSETGQFGFADSLAVGDANLIIGPLTRRTAACLSAMPFPHVTLTTKRSVQEINATFVKGCRQEVACHPDDARETRNVVSHRGNLSIAHLIGSAPVD